MLDHALVYLEQGKPVFPVCSPAMGSHKHGAEVCPKDGRGKRPMIPWKAYQERFPTDEEARGWWGRWPDANIGMATGRLSGVTVLDADGLEPRKEILRRGVSPTPTVWTGKVGGCHFHFAHPGREVKNFAGKLPGTDFRGDGGYVLLPPSLHASRARYRWAEHTQQLPLAPLPTWLESLERTPETTEGHEPLDLARLLDGVKEGGRDDTIFRFACKLRGDSVPYQYAELTVLQAARLCRPPFDEQAAIEKVKRAYREYPAGRAEEKRTGARLDVVRMADVHPEPIEWSWRGRFARGKPTLLMGDPGLGKSLITHYSAAIVSTGGLWPDGERCERGTAILFTTEDGLADTVAPRLIAAGADMTRVLAVRGVFEKEDSTDARMFALTEHLALLEQLIEENGASFVAIDPVSAYLGPDVNSHKEADVRNVLAPLSLLAERTRIVLVMLMHLNKGSGVSALYRATGSIAFPAVARVVLGVATDPNDEKRRLLLPIKMNIGVVQAGIGYRIETHTAPAPILVAATAEDQPPVIAWDDEPVTIDATSALDRSGSAQEVGAASEVKDILRELLSSGRVSANECKRVVRETTGMTGESVLSRARRDLGVKVHRVGFGQGSVWFWEIPSVGSPAEDSHTRARKTSIESMNQWEPSGDQPPSIEAKAPIDTKTPIDSMNLPRARERTPAMQRADPTTRYCEDCGKPTRNAELARCVDCRIARREIVDPRTGWVMTSPGIYEDPNPPPELPL